MDSFNMNVLVLAYLGDTVYEGYVRRFLIFSGISHVKELQEASIFYVSAKGQAKFLSSLLERNFFFEDELSVIMRARNYKGSRHPKNCDILTYKHATALEAVIGYLSLSDKNERIEEMMKLILEGKLC